MIYDVFFVALMIIAAVCAWRICVADMRRRIIPDAYLFPILLVGLICLAFYPTRFACTIGDAAIGAAFGYALGAGVGFVFDWFLRRRDPNAQIPIGFGDIKLLAAGGLWLGPTGLAWALVASCIGGLVWARTRHVRYIPFAPFFIGGAILALITNLFLL